MTDSQHRITAAAILILSLAGACSKPHGGDPGSAPAPVETTVAPPQPAVPPASAQPSSQPTSQASEPASTSKPPCGPVQLGGTWTPAAPGTLGGHFTPGPVVNTCDSAPPPIVAPARAMPVPVRPALPSPTRDAAATH